MSAHVARLGRELGEARERVSARGHSSSSDNSDNSDNEGRNGQRPDKPTEEMVERMEEKLEAAQADQKNLFLIIFQVSYVTLAFACYSVFIIRWQH